LTDAEQALRLATAAGDPWQIASASMQKAFTASTIAELRERVDRAATLLDEVGNTYLLAAMLAGTPYVALCMGADGAARELADRALPIVRELGTPFEWMILCGNLGLTALMTGDTDRAMHAFREQLTLCREMVVLPMAAEGLRGSAHSPPSAATTIAPRGSQAPQPPTATTNPTTRSRFDSTRRSSSPPATGSGLTRGTQRSSKGSR
jgi:hypothetical protein